MERVIFHVDMNAFYASVEQSEVPELRGKPIAVAGSTEKRNGIILTASYEAKNLGVKTGMANFQALQKCPNLIYVKPRMDLYLRYSRMAREIYEEYTDKIESFGIDECWLDVTGSAHLFGGPIKLAITLKERIKFELGITCSIGVSWNKIFAKLGSDYKKPDAITYIDKENFKQIVWPLPAKDLLYVGSATSEKLTRNGVMTIGDLAQMPVKYMDNILGKMGVVLHQFANGNDISEVADKDFSVPIKSVGNSWTTPRDLTSEEDVKLVMFLLSESVAARLRENHFKCNIVEISVRDTDLYSFVRQMQFPCATNITTDIAKTAIGIFRKHYKWGKNIRSVGVRAANLSHEDTPQQTTLEVNEAKRDELLCIDKTVDTIRGRFGFHSVKRGLALVDAKFTQLNAKEDHTVHPHGYF